MKKQLIRKTVGDLSHIAFVIPAMVFWALFLYCGASLEGFFSFLALIMHSYQSANESSRDVFAHYVVYFYTGFLFFLSIIVFLLNLGKGEEGNA